MVDWILILAIATFVCVVAYLVWTKLSTASKHRNPDYTDPQSASGHVIRPPEEIRASLDAAANAPGKIVVENP
jgi:hypothetical protein